MINKIITHNFQLVDDFDISDYDLNTAYSIIINRVNSFINTEKGDTIVVENLDNSIQSYLLVKLLHTTAIYHSNISIIILKEPFKRLPKFVRNYKYKVMNIRNFNKVKNNMQYKEFSPLMIHNYLDNKYQDSRYTKITYYPFKDFTLFTLYKIVKEFFNYETEENLYLDFYNNIKEGKITEEILKVYKMFNKLSLNTRVILVHEIKNIYAFNSFLNKNPNVLPIYFNNTLNKNDINKNISLLSQKVKQDKNTFTLYEIEKKAESIRRLQGDSNCGQLGQPEPLYEKAIRQNFKTYQIEEEVNCYGIQNI